MQSADNTPPSRRDALFAGGILLAGAIARNVTPATAHGRVVLGSNSGVFAQFQADMPPGTQLGIRTYYDGVNEFPEAWPARHPGAWTTLSLRPDPAQLLAGKLDAPLKAIISSAPGHSELTFWHENTTGNPLGYPSSVNNPATAVAMQRYGHRLCAGTAVRFGVITVGPAWQQDKMIASGLDWYGDDLYAWPRLHQNGKLSKTLTYQRLNQELTFWRKKSGKRWPSIRICETSSPVTAELEEWFTWLAAWGSENNMHRILTFWGGAQGASVDWPPPATVIKRLRYLSSLYGG